MYQLKKDKNNVYCAETIYKDDGSHTTIIHGRCEIRPICKEICGTLRKNKKNMENRLHRRILRKLQIIRS